MVGGLDLAAALRALAARICLYHASAPPAAAFGRAFEGAFRKQSFRNVASRTWSSKFAAPSVTSISARVKHGLERLARDEQVQQVGLSQVM